MRSIVRGVVALFAAFCIMDVVKAAPTIVSPADNAEVKTISDKIWNDIHNDSIYLSQSTFYEGTHTSTYRKSAMADVNTNSVPIELKWSGTSGECTVKIWRTRDLTANSSASPIFTTKVTGTTATYWDPEVGRDFTWSVTDSTGASVIGHFHTLQRTPRIIYADQNPDAAGAECSAGRDIGGWLTEDRTKRVRQGLVFRSAQIEYCSSGAGDHVYYPLTYLKDVLGIKLDLDLREDSHLGKYYAYPTNQVWSCSWKKNNSEYSEVYLKKAESNIGPGIPRYCVDTSYAAFPSYTGFTSNDSNKKSVWAAFTQIHDRVTKTTPEAVLFHCSHGKDRTGSLAYILLGALGVSEKDARRDFGFTWYLEAKSDVAMETAGGDGYEGLTKLLNALPSGSTFKARCVAYLKACGTAAGDSDPEGKITAFQNAMLEAVEYQEDAYELSKEDSFTYNELYWRRKDGGGTFGSEYSGSVASKKGTLNYWYKTSTSTTANQVSTSWLDYNACYYFWPVSSLPWATPSCSYYKAGKIVSVCKSTSFTIGPYGLKAYFTDVDHTVSDRTIIEHREGLAHFDNFDIYFTKYDRTTTNSDGSLKYSGETGNKTLPSVYSGVGSLDVWANATFRASDMRDMSIYATHSSINKKPKLYLKFPSGNCNNARFEAVNGNDVNTYLGWFTGGDAGTKQYIKVEDSFLHFKSTDKVNGVAGVLGLEFTLGSQNTTSSAAMMQIAGSLKINSGSTITVNAGGKGAGTYKLITTTGSLTDNANLTSYSTYKVTNCASGCYGTIIKNSTGKTVSVKIVKGTDPNEGTGGDVVEPETPTIEDIGTAQNGDWGYRVNIGNDVAIVFTNHNKTVNWTVPNTVKNVRYLVVAGGGGGGADFNTESNSAPFQGGAGGGGGAVIEGTIPELSKSSVLTVTVGAGGFGGVTSIDNSDNGGIGAAASGSPSIVKLDTADYIIAYGGGGDGGASDESSKTGNVGKSGGSSAGSRPGQTEVAEITPSYIHESLAATSTSYGNKGGAGYYVATPDNNNTWWGYVAAAGGGGGATSVGADATSSSKPGDGGSGLTSDITGSNLVYGSGGGAGTISAADDIVAGKGGTGAGDGATAGNAGGNALANQGGGGGGGARKAAGGNGGSGIVVIRYSTVTGPINPTEYGTTDSAASTYTWIGYTGPWMYTTNWTATASGTYGVPNNGTYATADFPAALVNAFTCTLNQSVSVNKAEFNSPNMTFVLDNALLTLKGKVDSYAACDFGDGENDNSTIELRGANAGIVSASNEVRLNFGYRHGDVTPTGTVTVRFVVPETGWESDARIKATGRDSKVVFYENSKLEIDATALGVPAEGTTKTVYLASGTGDNGVYVESKMTNIVCAAGAKGSIKIESKKLVLTVEADETTEPDEPQEPQLTAVDVPVAQTGLVYTGSELTGVESVAGYTLTGNTATDAGEYTAIATLAEGYKWSDDTTADKSITWVITKATNEWTTEPKISLESWTQGEAAGVLTSGVAKFGTVTASMTELPTEVGSYTITYTVAETKNYTGLTATVQFEIKEMVDPGDLIAVKPTVNYASGTKFTAIGVEQKPILTPVSGEGYKVSYEGDFTSSGTHKIIITLDNNWKWSDGSSDILVFQYTFVDRNFTKEFYASGSGRFQSSSRWYNKALTTKLNAYPTEYTHKAYSTTASSSAHMDDSLETKVGMFVVSGGEYKLTYGVLNFQNETVTHLPMWVTEPGCMTTIQATKMPLNGGGVGYFELGAGATNRFGLVDASENFYIRYATDGDLGSVTEFYDSGDSPVNTKLGWFDGGAEGIVSELIVTNTSVKFAKVGAISGVAGPLAVTVALGENNIERPSIDVVGTLKINQGSTLNVNANGMPCGVYTIITAGEFIGADILTTDQGGVVTGLAENTSGVIEREGNTIKLYIETTILPTVPGIDGESVSINDVFNSARVSKPIWYKTRPEIIDGKIVFNRIPVEIPEYYNVSVEALTEGYLIKLVLKDNLTPYIGNKVDDDVVTTPAIKIENGKVKIHLEGTHKKLYYSLKTSTSLESGATWTTADGDWIDNANFTFGDGDQKLDDVRFFKVGEVSDEPIE